MQNYDTKMKNKHLIFEVGNFPNCNDCPVAIVTGRIPPIRKAVKENLRVS